MKNVMLVIEYEGTNFSGWQRQIGQRTVEEEIEKTLRKISKEEIKIIGSGRTDAKVHALGQVANFKTRSTIPASRFKYILNNRLPEDIRIRESKEVNMDFHSRFSAKAKQYKYIIYNNKMPSALYRNFSYHIPRNLDIDKMTDAACEFIGTHDFASFKGRRSVVKDTIRTIYKIDIKRKKDLIEINILGKSFLRYMIRIIVGTLIEVGYGNLNRQDIREIIACKNRTKAKKTAEPQGLFLMKVYY